MIFQANITREGLAQYFLNFPHKRGICVCEQRKFIYMKPAKTAGTTILRHILEPQLDIMHAKEESERFRKWLERLTDKELAEYFIFSVVRNPWDRVVSLATYFEISFQKFLYDFEKFQSDPIIHTHTLPQAIYTHYNGKPFVNQVCRFESLQADFNLICDQIGIQRQELPVTNRSFHSHYSRYFSPASISWVTKHYQQDIAVFGYMFAESPSLKTRLAAYAQFMLNKLKKRLK